MINMLNVLIADGWQFHKFFPASNENFFRLFLGLKDLICPCEKANSCQDRKDPINRTSPSDIITPTSSYRITFHTILILFLVCHLIVITHLKKPDMKKLVIFACVLLIASSSFANKPVSEKVLKVFKATFTGAENVVWTDTENIYTVKFTQLGIYTFVAYDKDGNFIGSRRYYLADKLPVDIQCNLKKKFADKTIFGVTEYTIGDEVNYFVKLEDAKTWTTVKIDNARNMDVTEKYQK